MSGFVIESFTPVAKNSLIGFATVRAPSGLVFVDCSVHRKGDSMWVSPPSKAMMNKDGIALRDADGKIRWQPVLEFRDKQVRSRWSAGVVAALKEQRPEVLS